MNSFWQSIIRISSLGIIVILLYFGVDLMKNTNGTSFAGSGLIFVGITLAVISFIDWRKREDYEHLIKQQGAVIKDLGQQISESRKTDVAFQKYTRGNLETTDSRLQSQQSKYSPDTDTEEGTQDI